MTKLFISFIISFSAGLSTLLGILPIFIGNKYQNKVIAFSLAFSSGVMIAISLFSLIPESINYMADEISFPIIILFLIFFLLGIGISFLIDTGVAFKVKNHNLYRVGIISIIALIIHNIPEGITSFLTTSSNLKLGIALSIGIALHNIPEGIAIAVPIYYSTNSKFRACLYTGIAGFSELLGAILAYCFFLKFINSFFLSLILAITAGIMVHVSLG